LVYVLKEILKILLHVSYILKIMSTIARANCILKRMLTIYLYFKNKIWAKCNSKGTCTIVNRCASNGTFTIPKARCNPKGTSNVTRVSTTTLWTKCVLKRASIITKVKCALKAVSTRHKEWTWTIWDVCNMK